MKTKKITITETAVLLLSLFLVDPVSTVFAVPPILDEETNQEAAEAENQKEREKTPEEKEKEKKEKAFSKELSGLRTRQERVEKEVRVRANIFPSTPPGIECTAADRARTRLEKVTGEGGVVILGDVVIDSSNDADVEDNNGSINNEVNVNIINQTEKQC
ncbi:MAG: hypothetical protein WAO55_15960 [Candidatus Manganitrophaceae bacterium]